MRLRKYNQFRHCRFGRGSCNFKVFVGSLKRENKRDISSPLLWDRFKKEKEWGGCENGRGNSRSTRKWNR